jgi:hypothetical protein
MSIICALLSIHGKTTHADELPPRTEQELRALIIEQTQRLEALKRKVAEEESKLSEIRQAIGLDTLRNLRGGASLQPEAAEAPAAPEGQASEPTAVGQAPAPSNDNQPPQVAPIFDQPGVLTPRGKLVLEPSLQYGYSSSNRVSLVGYTIIPALTIGLIDVREVKRNTWTAALTGRWGITNRFEIEAKLPYVSRSDSVLSRPQNLGAAQDDLFSSTGKGIGDFEMTGRYQLNNGGLDRPYYVGTLRLKSRTGKDPFEVTTDLGTNPNTRTGGLQSELPTGSGFYTLQPGLTVLYPSDPAVFFGSVSYQYNFKRSNVSMNTTSGEQFVGDVQPGGVFGFNFGMGLALNERSSFSLGYDHASVGRLKQNGDFAPNSVRTELGTLLLGYSHRVDKNTWLNLSVGAGVTRDAPDLTLTLRLPMTF